MAVRLLAAILLLAGLSVLPGARPAGAQDADKAAAEETALPTFSPVSVAVIDLRAVLSRSDAAANIRKAVEARRAAYREEFAAIEKELINEQNALIQKRAILSKQALDAEVARLKEKERKAQQDAQLRNQQLKQAFDSALDKVQKELLEVVANLADESGIGLVLFRSSIVLAVKEIEISEEALKRLNRKIQTVDVVFEP